MQSGTKRRISGATPNQPISADSKALQDRVYRRLLEDLTVGVAHVSLSGRLLYANRAFLDAIAGVGVGVGGLVKDLFSAASWDALSRALQLARHGPIEGEMTIDTAHDSPRILRVSLNPLRMGKSTTIRMVTLEVTELITANRALRDSEQSLQSLSARILRLQDEERRRIARDLHDTTGQELAVISMSLTQIANHLERPPQDNRQGILDAIDLVHKVEDEIRTLSYLLHPPLLDEFGIQSALNWYVQGFSKRSGINVAIQVRDQVPRLESEKETALFRVVQESLSNVLRHSGSKEAVVNLAVTGKNVRITIADSGAGIPVAKLRQIRSGKATLGVGIAGIRERIEQIGGHVWIHSNGQTAGTIVHVEVPTGSTVASAPSSAGQSGQDKPHDDKTSAKPERKRILIADDQEMIRQGVRSLLATMVDVEVCGEAINGMEAVAMAGRLQPDLVILDLSMPKVGGLSAARRIREMNIPTKILMFTDQPNENIDNAVRHSGCEGCVAKSNVANLLTEAVQALLAGKQFFSPGLPQRAKAQAGSANL